MANIYDYDARDVLAGVLDCGIYDVDFLIDKINKFDLDFPDVKDYVKEFSDKLDIGNLVVGTFEYAGKRFLDEVRNYIVNANLSNDSSGEVDEDIVEFFNVDAEQLSLDLNEIDEYDMNVYFNYLDSSFDSNLENYDITDFSEENIRDFIIDTYGLTLRNEDTLNDDESENNAHLDKIVKDFDEVTKDSNGGNVDSSESKKSKRTNRQK